MEKNELRTLALKKRKECPEKGDKSRIIALRVLDEIKDKQVIGLYVSKGDEVETHDLIQTCLSQGKTLVVPKVIKKTIIFVEIKSMDDLEPGVFGLLEPKSNDEYDLSKIEIMIIPMVGFDSLKHRIGYGKGYYDSVLDKIQCDFVGIAYACQQVEDFICSVHDVPMTKILTEYSEF